jgi:uncharacterized membrane protein YfcA
VLQALLIGLVVGVVVGVLGAGGGILSVPILVYGLGQAPHSAAASSLVIVGATAVAGSIHHLRHRTIDWGNGLAFGLLGLAGSFLGSRASVRTDPTLLMALFAGLLAVVSVAMFAKAARDRRQQPADDRTARARQAAPRRSLGQWLKIFALASLTGGVTGFFGVGGGFVVVPMLVLALGLPMRTAAGTSLLVMVITTSSGLLSRVGTHVVIDWPLTTAFTIGSMTGGLLGGPLTSRVPGWVLTLAFGVLLGLVSVGVALLNRG